MAVLLVVWDNVYLSLYYVFLLCVDCLRQPLENEIPFSQFMWAFISFILNISA